MKLIWAATLGALTLFTSCKEPSPLSEGAGFKSIDRRGWVYGDSYEFNPSPDFAEARGTARMAVVVRHTGAYLYSNLWLEVATPVAPGDSMKLDTINIKLADIYGRWLGKGLGVSYVKTDTLPGRYGFDEDVPAKVRHIMRVDTLNDVEQIGLIYFEPVPHQTHSK